MYIKKLPFILLFLFQLNIYAQNNVIVNNITAYNQAIKNAKPGTTIILKNGIWKDVHLKAYGKGTKENPIIIKAQNAGKVIINGDSKLDIYGEYITVKGLWFKDGKPTSNSVISFKKNNHQFANNCRFTNNTISYFNPILTNSKSNWINLWGKNNRVDHNNLTGKTNIGSTIVVWLKNKASIENNHSIDHNYFGPRPELGVNGGETIRIGSFPTSTKSSNTIVESNTFERCNGDIEIIANKSCNNIYRNNLFIANKGALTLRFGKNALVEKNVFLGKNEQKTGGIRISDQEHVITNNVFIGLRGRTSRAPIAVMHGAPDSPTNTYKQVRNVSIQNNTLINCSTIDFATSKDKKKLLAPRNTLFANNLVTNKDGTKILDPADDISGIFFKNNIAETTAEVDTNIFTKQNITWKNVNSIPMPTKSNNQLISDYISATTPKKDINGKDRSPFIVGAFNFDNTITPKALKLKSGPSWKPTIIIKKEAAKTIIVKPGIGTLYKAIKEATSNTIFKLKDGVYQFKKTRKIDGDVTIIGSEKSVLKLYDDLETIPKTFFKINENSTLSIKNLTFDGTINNIKYAIVSPSKDKKSTYKLFVDNCVFKNFTTDKGAIIRGYTNTLADTISIKNSTFLDSFRGMNFQSKNNNPGIVNVKNLIIENSIFKNIEEFAIKYAENSGNPKIKKGKILISNAVFSNVSNRNKGKIINIKNIYFAEIKNSVFENSSKITNFINLSGAKNSIKNCLVNSSGTPKITKGAITKNILYKSPKWRDRKKFIPGRKSFLLKTNNKFGDIGLSK